MIRRSQTVRLRVTIRRVSVVASCFLILAVGMFAIFNLGSRKKAQAATETIASGSFIINMGVTPQTFANGLKPYGMLYDLIVNYKIQIKWVINSSKARDGIDFTHNAVNYSGGPFIIEAASISAAIASRITYWQGQGVSGAFTAAPVSVPVYSTLSVFPTVTIDNLSNKQAVIAQYYTNAGIPSTAYGYGDPSVLTGCIDIWTNPHGDPAWSTHDDLYQFVTTYKSWIWAQCHSVSVMESCKEAVSPFRQLNFLSSNGLQCYGNNKCLPILETHAGGATSPFTYSLPSDPIMQFIGDMHQATTSGSENWYIPTTTGQWNANTKQCVMSSDGSGSRKGTVLVYGPAYGNAANGYVMYEGGHDLDGSGTTAQKTAAQRAYFNFLLTAGISKALQITSTVPATAYAKEKVDITGTAASGTGPYNFSWSSQLGAVFSSANQQTTKYHAPDVSTNTNDIITLTITDNCSRVNFITKPISIKTTLPIKLKSFNAYASDKDVKVEWTTAAEINNDHFTIERSKDGINYSTIGKVRGAGNSTILLNYSFIDEHPFDGTSYYRLKQTDYDGKSETFKPVSVNQKEKLKNINSLRTFPNPFSEIFTAEFESIEEIDVQVQLLDLNSVMISNESIHLDAGKNVYRFTATSKLKTGVYIFRIINGTTVLAVAKVYYRNN